MNKSYSEWLNENAAAAVSATAGTGIFPEILLAQAIIESAKNGAMPGTKLAKQYNNYFGIKAGSSWKGSTADMLTGEYTKNGQHVEERAKFRSYNSPAGSFKDYVKLLTKSKRYKKALQATTPRAQAAELQAAGYSTNPNYKNIVASLAETFSNLLTTIKANPGKTAAGAGVLLAAAAAALYLMASNGK